MKRRDFTAFAAAMVVPLHYRHFVDEVDDAGRHQTVDAILARARFFYMKASCVEQRHQDASRRGAPIAELRELQQEVDTAFKTADDFLRAALEARL